jgi:nicotinamidase-related amidase
MSAPKTLLEMAGAPNRPQRLSEAAVVMIDAQLEYVTGRLPLTGVGPALEAGAELLAAARAAGRPVIHVQHRGRGDGLFGPDSPFFAIAPEVAAEAGEPVVEKVVPNAFADGALDAKLKQLGVSKIIIGGFMTHLCVSTTARAALDLGFHRIELAALSDRFATIATAVSQLAD